MTQREVAARLGLSPARLTRYESGRRLPPLLTLLDLAVLLAVPLDVLLRPPARASDLGLWERFGKVLALGAAEREMAAGVLDMLLGLTAYARQRGAGARPAPREDAARRIQDRLREIEKLAGAEAEASAALLEVVAGILRYLRTPGA